MPDVPFTVVLLIVLALVFDFLNGFHDSSNIVATMIASRALSGRQALDRYCATPRPCRGPPAGCGPLPSSGAFAETASGSRHGRPRPDGSPAGRPGGVFRSGYQPVNSADRDRDFQGSKRVTVPETSSDQFPATSITRT